MQGGSNVHFPQTYFLHLEQIFMILLSLQYFICFMFIKICRRINRCSFRICYSYLFFSVLDNQRQVLLLTGVKILSRYIFFCRFFIQYPGIYVC